MRVISFFLCITAFYAHSQALRDINYSYLYDESAPARLQFRTVRDTTSWTAYYQVSLTDLTQDPGIFEVKFEMRKNLYEKSGTLVPEEQINRKDRLSGSVTIERTDQPQVLLAHVIHSERNTAWYFYTILEPKHPVTTLVDASGKPIVNAFINVPDTLTVSASSGQIVSYYNDKFPPAPLPFSEKLGAVSKGMRVDSTFYVLPAQPFIATQNGLYLVQSDTIKNEGFVFRAHDDYPRYTRLQNVAEPFVYICTRQEYQKIRDALDDKKAFDRVILSITRDQERAKKLIRSYFRRVEMANTLFTSYKEGWKTDRGMIYIIFGPPDEVFRFNDREVWNYKIIKQGLSFDFAHSPSLFDPDNFVLIRSKKYTETWYQMIDMWRSARF